MGQVERNAPLGRPCRVRGDGLSLDAQVEIDSLCHTRRNHLDLHRLSGCVGCPIGTEQERVLAILDDQIQAGARHVPLCVLRRDPQLDRVPVRRKANLRLSCSIGLRLHGLFAIGERDRQIAGRGATIRIDDANVDPVFDPGLERTAFRSRRDPERLARSRHHDLPPAGATGRVDSHCGQAQLRGIVAHRAERGLIPRHGQQQGPIGAGLSTRVKGVLALTQGPRCCYRGTAHRLAVHTADDHRHLYGLPGQHIGLPGTDLHVQLILRARFDGERLLGRGVTQLGDDAIGALVHQVRQVAGAVRRPVHRGHGRLGAKPVAVRIQNGQRDRCIAHGAPADLARSGQPRVHRLFRPVDPLYRTQREVYRTPEGHRAHHPLCAYAPRRIDDQRPTVAGHVWHGKADLCRTLRVTLARIQHLPVVGAGARCERDAQCCIRDRLPRAWIADQHPHGALRAGHVRSGPKNQRLLQVRRLGRKKRQRRRGQRQGRTQRNQQPGHPAQDREHNGDKSQAPKDLPDPPPQCVLGFGEWVRRHV